MGKKEWRFADAFLFWCYILECVCFSKTLVFNAKMNFFLIFVPKFRPQKTFKNPTQNDIFWKIPLSTLHFDKISTSIFPSKTNAK